MQHACTRPCVLRISRWANMSCAGMCDAARRGDIMEQCSLHPLLEWGLASFLWLDSYNDDDGGEGMVTSCWVPLWHVPLGCLCACWWCVPAVSWVAAVIEVAVACGAVKCNGQAGVIARKLLCTRYCYTAGRGSAGTVSVHTGSRKGSGVAVARTLGTGPAVCLCAFQYLGVVGGLDGANGLRSAVLVQACCSASCYWNAIRMLLECRTAVR